MSLYSCFTLSINFKQARPLSIDDHSLSNYMEYMESFSLVNPDLGYSNSFESNEIGSGYKIRGHFLHSSNDVVTQ